MQLHTAIGVLLLLGVSHAQFYELHDGNEKDAWLAGVFTPQPLRAVPWQAGAEATPTPVPATMGGLAVPGVGELQGLRGYKLIKGRPIDAYLGVRYGQVNSGLGRFQPARTMPYQARINASQPSANCAQFPELQRLQRAEALGENVDDCLNLNIYAPAGARELPVLVFVHGEMLFDGGAEEAQPDYVLEHDVLLVAINYRLAPFGFLSALSDELPGNVALSDLQLALEWVQRNIRHFGGSPGQVTLVGQAGGATLAHALSLSPKTQHLFQQLILQSGTALNPYLIDERPLDTLATFAQLAHCPSLSPSLSQRNLSPLYECLRRQRTSQLVSAFEQLLQQNEPRGLSALGAFKLVVGDRLGYLPEHPAALVASSSANNQTKPLIVGATKDASAFILSRFYDQIERLQSHNLSDYINVVLRHTAPAEQHKTWHDWAVREIFTPEQARYANARSVTQGLLELSNIILYRAPVIHSIRLAHKKSPVYLYTFDYRGEHHRFGHLNSPLPFGVDASLSDDSVYLFPYPVEVSHLNPEDKSLARALVAMWVNFAQSGVPNPATNVWPKATSEHGPFLRFTNSRHSILELDQHFGDGLDVPNVYGQYLNATNATTPGNATTTPQPPTRRPYFTIPWQPYRPQQQLPEYGRPPAYNDYYQRAQEHRRQQLLREQQERELKLREQLEREQQQRGELLREEEERRREQQQRDEELQREQQQREQFEREQRQRAQEQREHAARQLQEQQEQTEGEREERENEMRRQQEREQQLRGQQEREQLEREQRLHAMPEEREQQAREQQQREQQQREHQQREREEREQEARDQLAREQQQREQLAREQEERAQQPSPPQDDRQPNPSDYPTYEDYVKAYTQFVQEQESLYNPESFASPEEDTLDDAGPDGH